MPSEDTQYKRVFLYLFVDCMILSLHMCWGIDHDRCMYAEEHPPRQTHTFSPVDVYIQMKGHPDHHHQEEEEEEEGRIRFRKMT